jgi:hypothetical protein
MAVAVLLASCTGGEKPSAAPPSGGTPSAPATTAPPSASPSPGKTKPPHRTPKHRPVFRFRVTNERPTLTTKRMREAKARRATRKATKAIKQRFDRLFRQTFVDPHHWRNAKYGRAFQAAFAGQARDVARTSRKKLTLGPSAGRKFESVSQATGKLQVNVLIGPQGGPITAAVRAWFNEKARRTGGGTTAIVSDGRYFLQPVKKRGWIIVAFHVGRHDHKLKRHR